MGEVATAMKTSLVLALLLVSRFGALASGSVTGHTAAASSTALGTSPQGAQDGHRFEVEPTQTWRGSTNENRWWWELQFAEPRAIGAILQIVGDHEFVLRNIPRSYIWQVTKDGVTWTDLPETKQVEERRTFRIHRLKSAQSIKGLRLQINSVSGEAPVLREVEIYPTTNATIAFPDWFVAVNTTHDGALPGHGQEFIALAKSCDGWGNLQAQQVWLDAFDADFINAEPRPLAAFLSGNFKDWCQVDRQLWRGTQDILRLGTLPVWASCGGAQGLAILAETGIEQPWDCPHCRDPKKPRLPIYTHIGHEQHDRLLKCGDYSACIHERGPHDIAKVGDDPVFRG